MMLAICLSAIGLALLVLWWASNRKPARTRRTLGGHTHEPSEQAAAQAGTNAAPPAGGAAAAPQPSRTAPQSAETPRGKSLLSRILRTSLWLGLVVILLSFIPNNVWGWGASYLTKIFHRNPTLEHNYTGPGNGNLVDYSTDIVDPKKAGQAFEIGLGNGPPEGSPLFEVSGRMICDVWRPESRVGETVHFQCYKYKHKCWGSNSNHRECSLTLLRNGRFDWILGSQWKCSNVVKGTDVLYAWTCSPNGSVLLKFETRPRDR